MDYKYTLSHLLLYHIPDQQQKIQTQHGQSALLSFLAKEKKSR